MTTLKQRISAAIREADNKLAIELIDDNPDLLNEIGRYWINFAAETDNLEMMTYLFRNGVRLTDLGLLKRSPLAAASTSGATGAAQWLFENGIIASEDNSSSSPLELAIRSNHFEMVKLLIENGANKNEQIGWAKISLLDFAEDHACSEISQYLRQQGLVLMRAPSPPKSENPPSRPLSETECNNIESALGLRLSSEYKSLLQALPEGLHCETGCADGFLYIPSFIIDETKAARDFKEEHWPEPFPQNMIVIGGNGGGDNYCVNADEDGSIVYLFDHENGCIDPKQRTPLSDFFRDMVNRE